MLFRSDVESYYPALIIEYDFMSRQSREPELYRIIRDERLHYKKIKDDREKPLKIVLNGTFGAMKDEYNSLYDPVQANNICINGQLLLLDLLEKLDGYCDLIQYNTDGLILKYADKVFDKMEEKSTYIGAKISY